MEFSAEVTVRVRVRVRLPRLRLSDRGIQLMVLFFTAVAAVAAVGDLF
jgi:hypothetical protein